MSHATDYHTTPVKEFHEVFGHPVENKPTVPSQDQRVLRVALLAEELAELAEASGVILDVMWADGRHAISARADDDVSDNEVNLVECADALGDIRVLTDGGNLIFGFPGEAVLAEIHRSNMSKLGEDGKPIRRHDGKILKGPNYTPPNIEAVLVAHTPKVPA